MYETEAERLLAALSAYRVKGTAEVTPIDIPGGFKVKLDGDITARFMWDGETYDALVCSLERANVRGQPFVLSCGDIGSLQAQLNKFR